MDTHSRNPALSTGSVRAERYRGEGVAEGRSSLCGGDETTPFVLRFEEERRYEVLDSIEGYHVTDTGGAFLLS